MAATLRRGSWAPALLVLGAAVGVAAMLGLVVDSLTWWIALAALLVLGLVLGWRERERKLRALRPSPTPPPLRLIEGGKARQQGEPEEEPAKPTETPRWLM